MRFFLNIFFSLQVDRRSQVDLITRHRLGKGSRAWRKLMHCLIEMKCLFGPSGDQLCNQSPVCFEIPWSVMLQFTNFPFILAPCVYVGNLWCLLSHKMYTIYMCFCIYI